MSGRRLQPRHACAASWLVGFLVTVTAAGAEPWACEFTVECIAGETCSESDFDVEILAADHEGLLFLSSLVGDVPVDRLTEAGTLPAAYASAGHDGPSEMLTIAADGTALMSAHILDGATMSVTYFGACEEF